MKALIAVAVLAAQALAGCSSGSASHPATHAAPSSPAAAPSSAAPSPSPASAAVLTRHQAARAYTEIVDPSNRAGDTVNQDQTDRVPMAQFHADARAYLAALKVTAARLAAVRWPARVEPYIHAMLTTDVQADFRCYRELRAATSYSQVNSLSFNQDCTAVENTSNADTIRSLLGLPGLGG
jgi:hypothetical protein